MTPADRSLLWVAEATFWLGSAALLLLCWGGGRGGAVGFVAGAAALRALASGAKWRLRANARTHRINRS